MNSTRRFRKRALAACLAAALALGTPLAPAGATAAKHATPGRAPDARHFAGAGSGLLRTAPDGIAGTRVTSCADAGAGSLREIIASAADYDTIDLRVLPCSTITLASAIPVTANGLYVIGPGAGRLTIDANASSRLFEVTANYLQVSGLRLQNGFATGDGGCIVSTGYVSLFDSEVSGCHVHTSGTYARGGAIFANGVDLFRSTVSSSLAESDSGNALGGGIYSSGAIDIDTSTLDSNEARAASAYSFGGAAVVVGGGTIDASTISGNTARNVGAISFEGPNVSLTESTISGNTALNVLGGIYVRYPALVRHSTIAFNCASATVVNPSYIAAIGMQAYQASIELESSIVADNVLCLSRGAQRPDDTAYDIGFYGTLGAITGAHNLVGGAAVPLPGDTIRLDPMLAPLADNGGSTKTHALLPGSPAINHGDSATTDAFDQRGLSFARYNGTGVDIGAYEFESGGAVLAASSCADGGAGSLRALAATAISGDTIDLSGLTCGRITLSGGEIVLPQGNLRLLGPGSGQLAIDGNNAGRVFRQTGAGKLDLEGLSIEHGYYSGPFAGGGCIESPGFVVGTDVHFTGCHTRSTADVAYGGAVLAQGAAFYGSRFDDNGCASDGSESFGGAIAAAKMLTIANTTLAGNRATGGATNVVGGGFLSKGTATIAFSTLSDNDAAAAGAGYSRDLTVIQSTVSGNTATLEAGGVAGAMARSYNSTFALNATPASGLPAGVGFFAVTRGDIESSIFFGNVVGTTPYDVGSIDGAFFGANNVVGATERSMPFDTITDDPLLGPLQDNGGPTETHMLGVGSPAIDTGNDVLGFDTDQRGTGFARVVGSNADIGAVEKSAEPDDTIFEDSFDPT